MHLATGLLVLVGLVGAVGALAQYLRVRPWRSQVGRWLLASMTGLVALYGLVTANMLAGHYQGRDGVTLAVAVLLGAVQWWQWRLVWRSQRRKRGNGG